MSQVLERLVGSIPLVQRLSFTPETLLMQQFLEEEWLAGGADLGPLPAGQESVAIMRLIVQVQRSVRSLPSA